MCSTIVDLPVLASAGTCRQANPAHPPTESSELMIEYWFVDGPLEGQAVGLTTDEAEGHVLQVEVIDMDDPAGGTAPFLYRVVTAAQDSVPGTLRHVAGAA